MHLKIVLVIALPFVLGACAGNAEETPMDTTITEARAEWKKGYQLYTVREELGSADGVKQTLAHTHEMGYEQMESFGFMGGQFFGMSTAEFGEAVGAAKLTTPSGHYLPMQLADTAVGPIDPATIPQFLDAAQALGQHWVIIPWMSPAWRNAEGYGHLVTYLKELGAQANARGMRAGWHNHDFEFEPLHPDQADSPLVYEYLLAELTPELIDFEMDLHWVAFAGHKPTEWFEAHPGRFPLWHVKDFAADTLTQVPVGSGIIQWAEIFASAEVAGLQHYYIEQDVCTGMRAVECLEQSMAFAKEQEYMK